MASPQSVVKAHVQKRPTGVTGAVAAAVVVILKKCGVDLSVDEAVIIVGGLAAAVSLFTPRS